MRIKARRANKEIEDTAKQEAGPAGRPKSLTGEALSTWITA